MGFNAPAMPLRPLPSIESSTFYSQDWTDQASYVPRASTPDVFDRVTPITATVFFVLLGFMTCAALGLINPVIGAALMPKYKTLHWTFVTHTVLYAVLAGSSLVGIVTGIISSCACSCRLLEWVVDEELHDPRQRMQSYIAKFFVLETLLFAFLAFVTGLGLVHHSHPLPEDMNIGDAVVMFWLGEAIMAPVFLCVFAVIYFMGRRRHQ
ncbi:hypothetical protein C8Q70DRAFT_684331 [Cubamyces menziesii]|nr:hypothetical protein C8Q70DRAFT_684331 [Cubamyces menziesii]